MANLIMNAFAFKEEFQNSPQLGGEVTLKTIDIYMKNIYVSLKTAKMNNPLDDVALLTNAKIPYMYEKLFMMNDIKVIIVPFDEFIFPAKFAWALAFFKLCALKYMVNNYNYDKYLLIDADTITVSPLEELWEETSDGVMLINTGHSVGHRERQFIIKDYNKLYNTKKYIIHYGGELIAGKRSELIEFLALCKEVYNKIEKFNFNVAENIGDETIISIAAFEYKKIIPAQPYIYRYWTGRFYLVSTNYVYNAIAIWHLPSEKETGILRVFDYLVRYDEIPKYTRLRKMVGLPKTRRNISIQFLFEQIRKRLRS